jgi:hypothetical protein
MTRRWPALVLTAAVVAVPLLTACSDDDDDQPTPPTATLFEETINPNVSTPTS